MSKEFPLPDIGSGLQEAEIIEWHVEVGDTVAADQVLCEVETEKSVVEIPVPFGGVVLSLAGPAGSTVNVGEVLVVIGEAGEADATPEAPTAAAVKEPENSPEADAARVVSVAATASSMGATMERPIAMPLVRRLAKANCIEADGRLRQVLRMVREVDACTDDDEQIWQEVAFSKKRRPEEQETGDDN